MHSSCYVIVPDRQYQELEKYIKKTVAKYYSELEVEPYKEFYSKEETEYFAERNGFKNDIEGYRAYLKKNSRDSRIENGLLYDISTWNKDERWDAYSIQDTTKIKVKL